MFKRSWACFKIDTVLKCPLYSVIPNTKEEKCNLKKPMWGGFTTSGTHSEWQRS